MDYVTLKDIVIPAGTRLRSAPETSRFVVEHHEALIAFGPDSTGSLTLCIDEDLEPGLVTELL